MDIPKRTHAFLQIARFFNPFYRKQHTMLANDWGMVRLQTDCMTVVNLLEMPGIVQLTATNLVVRPCLGGAVSVPLDGIRGVRQARCFNGTVRVLEYQHGFWIEGAPGWRLGFAVTEADPWVAAFREIGIAGLEKV